MFAGKELRKTFRDAPWQSEAEVEAFVRDAGHLPAPELQKLAEVLGERSSGTSTQQRMRARVFVALGSQNSDPSLFTIYLKALRSADGIAREALVAVLPKVNNTAEHGELCELLGVEDGEVRRAAGQVLMQIGGVQAVQALQKILARRDFIGRADAMDAIMPKAGARAVPVLAVVLDVGTTDEKRRALAYLSDRKRMSQEPAAVQLVRRSLDDREEKVVCQAIETLSCLVSELDFMEEISTGLADSQSTPVIRAVMLGLRRYKSAAAVDFMARKVRIGPNAVRMVALEALEAMASDEAVPALVEALKHDQAAVRTRAAQALTNMAVERQIDLARTIIWLLRSRDPNIRRLAVEIAKKVGDPTGDLSPRLLRHLRDEDWWVRERVADALVEMAGANLTQHVMEYLEDPSDVVRRYAVGFLRRLKDPRALGALVRTLMNDSDWWVREWALDAMADLKDPRALPYILDVMQKAPELRPACFGTLVTLGATDTLPYVAQYLGDADAEVRLAAVKCVCALGGAQLAAHIQPLQHDPDMRVREHAKEHLLQWNALQKGGTNIISMTLLDRMLAAVVERGADDLILASGRLPMVKHQGKTEPLTDKVWSAEQVKGLLIPLLNPRQVQALDELVDVDFSHEVKTHQLRFRAHVFNQMTGLSAVFRTVKKTIPDLESLGLPKLVQGFGSFKNGLVLVGGPTGSGKSTTLAALIDHINRNSARHIVTLEDPIEVVHMRKESLINQREIGGHTKSFERGLRATLRQDPDVILVGELRDQNTISMAVTAAETGHLVFATVHTVSADTSVDRIVNAFPAAQQPQVRAMLAETLRAVLCQHLLRRRDGGGRVLAAEMMINTDAVANLIRKGKAFQIPQVIATARDQGMQTMDSELVRLTHAGVVSAEEAYSKANDKKAFEIAMGSAEKIAQVRAHAPAAAAPAASLPHKPRSVVVAPPRSVNIKPSAVPGRPITGPMPPNAPPGRPTSGPVPPGASTGPKRPPGVPQGGNG